MGLVLRAYPTIIWTSLLLLRLGVLKFSPQVLEALRSDVLVVVPPIEVYDLAMLWTCLRDVDFFVLLVDCGRDDLMAYGTDTVSLLDLSH